jgi:spermidine/putrescine transport system substrate-binding protein
MVGINAYTMSDAGWAKVQAKLKALMPQLRFVSSDDTALAQGLASGELVAAMSWRETFATLHREHKPVAYLEPPGGIFTYVCGLVVHKNPSDEAKALALIDSALSDEAAVYTIEHIAGGPANLTAMAKVPDRVFADLGIPRDLEGFLKHGIFQRRLKNKEKIIAAWTNLRAGIAAP